MDVPPQARSLYHFCRMQMPEVSLPEPVFQSHLLRTFQLFQRKSEAECQWPQYLTGLYVADWYLCICCLEKNEHAWMRLFRLKSGRNDTTLMDALRARAVRLYPRDEERQENAISEFYSLLLVSDSEKSQPVLARFDGQRPLVPWLIRVFQNWHISHLRAHNHEQTLPEDDVGLPMPARTDTRWHEAFIEAAQAWLNELNEQELLLLGLRFRYRLSQRDISTRLKVHEGTISRQTDKLRDHCLEKIGKELTARGWSGDDLEEYILTEMAGVLMDDSRLSVENLARLFQQRGLSVPTSP